MLRRSFIAGLLMTPAIVRASSLMRVSPIDRGFKEIEFLIPVTSEFITERFSDSYEIEFCNALGRGCDYIYTYVDGVTYKTRMPNAKT